MARARNIKPGFFSNDDLAENNCPLGRILFIGLWCLADYKGDVEWRTNRIKVQILPYDDCNIKQLAINLDLSGFVTFYSDGEKVYLRINNFDKHQNPHPNEKKKGSDIPDFTEEMRQLIDLKELAINRDKSRQVTERSITDRADSLIPHPDSLIPHPDSGADDSDAPQAASEKKAEKQKRFVSPEAEVINKFFVENGSNLHEAGSFLDHYTANGWMVGKAKMKDWQAAARNWIRRNGGRVAQFPGSQQAPRKPQGRPKNLMDVMLQQERQTEQERAAEAARRNG